jgi:hypothetical protein
MAASDGSSGDLASQSAAAERTSKSELRGRRPPRRSINGFTMDACVRASISPKPWRSLPTTTGSRGNCFNADASNRSSILPSTRQFAAAVRGKKPAQAGLDQEAAVAVRTAAVFENPPQRAPDGRNFPQVGQLKRHGPAI